MRLIRIGTKDGALYLRLADAAYKRRLQRIAIDLLAETFPELTTTEMPGTLRDVKAAVPKFFAKGG